MLAERPVLALAEEESDLAEVIRRAGCGWVVPPDQPQRLADRIREVIRSPYSDLKVRGSAGRVFALARFTSEACLTRVVELLENAILPCDNDNGMMDEEVEVRLGTLKE
jgi:glycosyltransferase involved in cell wall biosynthesis